MKGLTFMDTFFLIDYYLIKQGQYGVQNNGIRRVQPLNILISWQYEQLHIYLENSVMF